MSQFKGRIGALIAILILMFSQTILLKYIWSGGHIIFAYFLNVLSIGMLAYGIFTTLYWIYLPVLKIKKALENFASEPDEAIRTLDEIKLNFPLVEDIVALMNSIKVALESGHYVNVSKRQAELAALQSQINPHFLYNAIDSIRGDIIDDGQDGASDALEALSKLFRYSIDQSDSLTTFEQELENVFNYIKIIQYRFADRFTILTDFNQHDNEIMGYKLPRLILQPIVENAIKHGLEPKRGQGRVIIRVLKTQKRFLIIVEDDGVGMSLDRLDILNKKLKDNMLKKEYAGEGSGIALINVNDRIKLNFGDDYGIHINCQENLGTEVHISLPSVSKDTNN